MKKTMFNRGFTLIELLVVIAIIGILAAVVLASLNDARDSGTDASSKQSLGNLRSQAEIFYNQNSFTYAGMCATTKPTDLLAAATNGTCNDSATEWAASADLLVNDGTNVEWCVDSTGAAGPNTARGVATVCP